ncbi:Alpha/beta hydrolase fold-1, partial [Dillenia turbinata]
HHHFVLVHGLGLGAWSWCKIKPRLQSVGHKVTILDLAGSGIDTRTIEEIHKFSQYNEALMKIMASIPPSEKVILVGHSLGGMNIAFAMEMFPKIVSAAQLQLYPPDYLDTRFKPYGNPSENLTSTLYGPKFLSTQLYQLSPVEELTLATTLVRPGSTFTTDLSKAMKFTKNGYGSVPKVCIVSAEDKAIATKYQYWMIKKSGVKEVKVIPGADHMAMFSRPLQVAGFLLEVAAKYS